MIIFGGPSRYVQGAGTRHRLGGEILRFGPEATILIDPGLASAFAADMAESCAGAGLVTTRLAFGGECTPAERDRLAALAGSARLIVAAGGGKCLDTGKALAHRLGAEIITVPTIASTDAPTSHNYVMYDEAHRMLGVEKMPRNPALVVVDTEIIARAPRKLFTAGIGDAVGKIYEVEACAAAGGVNVFGGAPPAAAVALARLCHDVVIRRAEAALAAVDRGETDAALEETVEATILMSGLAFESGGLSVAHSMTRGLTAVPRYAAALHGLQVAYANLVQLRLEGRDEAEIDALSDFYGRVGLPRSLSELAGTPDDVDAATIAALTMTSPHIGHARISIDIESMLQAIHWVEGRYSRHHDP